MKLHDLHVLMAVVQAGSMNQAVTPCATQEKLAGRCCPAKKRDFIKQATVQSSTGKSISRTAVNDRAEGGSHVRA